MRGAGLLLCRRLLRTLEDEHCVTAYLPNPGLSPETLLRSVAGVIRNAPTQIRFEGVPIGGAEAADIASLGIAMVPEGRRLFPSLSVEENLLVGSYAIKRRATRAPGPWTLESVYAVFPALVAKRHLPATSLSGGQQQMLAIGRALMSNPRLLLCDEISLGLAPVVIRDIYAAFPRIQQTGCAIVIVEQDIGQALKVADRAHCMMGGRITLSGAPADLSREAIHKAYFGAVA